MNRPVNENYSTKVHNSAPRRTWLWPETALDAIWAMSDQKCVLMRPSNPCALSMNKVMDSFTNLLSMRCSFAAMPIGHGERSQSPDTDWDKKWHHQVHQSLSLPCSTWLEDSTPSENSFFCLNNGNVRCKSLNIDRFHCNLTIQDRDQYHNIALYRFTADYKRLFFSWSLPISCRSLYIM